MIMLSLDFYLHKTIAPTLVERLLLWKLLVEIFNFDLLKSKFQKLYQNPADLLSKETFTNFSLTLIAFS